MKRTHLPLNGLRVLDAAARHLSFTRAADELAVTPAAVGQQIRALEDLMGVVLFRRTPKGLELTDEAAAGLDALRSGFLQFEDAVRAMQAGQSSRMLTIAAPRDLAEKWLQPKLAQFASDHPETRFALVAGTGQDDFTEANLDCAITLTDGPGELEGVLIGDSDFLCIKATSADAGARIDWPGCPAGAEDEPVIRVADGGLAIAAAAHGFGHCWVPRLLAASDIAAGRVEAFGNPSKSSRGYWLTAPLPQWRQAKVRALVAALLMSDEV